MNAISSTDYARLWREGDKMALRIDILECISIDITDDLLKGASIAAYMAN